jgi:acetyl esterase/lipase
MPIGYLVTVALLAGCTLFALAPLRRPPARAGMSFRLGLVINEQPVVALYYLLASTLLAIGEGDIDSPGGWVVVGLAVMTTVGLTVIAERGLRAGPAVDHALSEGLVAGWRTATDAGTAAGLRRRLPYARILLRPVFVRRHDVERVPNISYGDAGKRNRLDVYRHRSHPSGGPTLIHLHGGRFVSGSKNSQALPLIYRLASQGWVCISANYRLSPAAKFPDHHIDAKKVVAWVREHGHEYGTRRWSSWRVAPRALTWPRSLLSRPTTPCSSPGSSMRTPRSPPPSRWAATSGPLDTTERSLSAPLAYVGPNAPPFFVIHGDQDTVVPVESARLFAERLRSASSNPVVYAELPGAQHSFDLFHSVRFETVVDAIEAFAAWVRSGKDTRAAHPARIT